ncbi:MULTISPECIES: SHOCT domain-containing protein [Clostridia]|uniref:SHOCT domain-containing protein n=1 Tax=Clostridia TaxID=186801 RepID=UPI0004213CF9|nr:MULTISPECIES: SHOCT domain-containing protein [Clostridia]WRR93985.1 SHOCT domain-containing protein [Sinanaerobacter sp. ZZT-01]
MENKKEAREMQYKLSVKLLDIMVNSGFLLPEEYEKIDALNRETFSPELAKVYA